MKRKIDFELLASALMFTGKLELHRYGIQYRTGKGVNDVKAAIRKAGKFGNAKTETELGLLEIYLQGIFKAA